MRSMLKVAIVPVIASLYAAIPAVAGPITAVVQSAANLKIKLDPVVNIGAGLTPIDAASMPGNASIYVGTYAPSSAQVIAVNPVTKTTAPFMTFVGSGVNITGQGLQGLTFSPNYNDSTKPGYRKFYTYEQETSPGAAGVMFLHPEVLAPGSVGVIREWTGNAAGTAINTAIPSRVVFNFGTPAGHMGGGMKFGPDGMLYLATGDGGGNGDGNGTAGNTDGFTGSATPSVPGISNGQDFTNVLGKVIRIDPYVTNANGTTRATPGGSTAKTFAGTTAYFIPGDNPFVNNPKNVFFRSNGSAAAPVAPLTELFAIGFRNPWKLSFDKNAVAGQGPFVANVGSHQREEIETIQAGKNYGWPYTEGEILAPAAISIGRPLIAGQLPYLKQTSPGVFANYDLDPTFSDPTQMTKPTAVLGTRSGSTSTLVFADRPGNDQDGDSIYGNQYGDGNSVVGGFVYRGSLLPALAGKYVFGVYQYLIDDPQTDPSHPVRAYGATSAGGKLLYYDPNEVASLKTIREFNFDLGFGIANQGILNTYNNIGDLMGVVQGDNGELYAMFINGDIKAIVPEPGSMMLLALGGLLMKQRRRSN